MRPKRLKASHKFTITQRRRGLYRSSAYLERRDIERHIKRKYLRKKRKSSNLWDVCTYPFARLWNKLSRISSNIDITIPTP